MSDNHGDWEARSPSEPEEWTPGQGLVRAAVWGTGTAIFLAALLAPVAWFAPVVLTTLLVRIVLGIVLVAILLGVAQNTAGFTGWPVTALGIILSGLVLASHHVVFALHGVPTRTGALIGWTWLEPSVLGTLNVGPMFAVCAVAMLCHRGVPTGLLSDFLMSGPGR